MVHALQVIEEAICCHPGVDDHKLRFETIGNYSMDVLLIYHVKVFEERWKIINEISLDLGG